MKFKKHEIVIMVILGIAIIVAGVMIFLVVREYSTGEEVYREMEEYVFLPEETPEPQTAPGTGTASASGGTGSGTPKPQNGAAEPPVIDTGAPTVDFASLQQQNPDIIGWIYSAGTPVNYPIVQGETNDEYLYRTANGTNNRCGSIFLDSANDSGFGDSNSVIHGHNMNNGSMFAELMNYEEQKYYDEHPRIWLVTPDQTYSLELFAGFVTSLDSDVWKLTFPEAGDFAAWKSEMAEKSYFQSNVVPKEGEKVVTLSTCCYDFENARFVVMGVLR